MIKLENILHPTDFSEPANGALEFAMELTDQFGCELHLLHVFPHSLTIPLSPDAFEPIQFTEAEAEYRQKVAESLASLIPFSWEKDHVVKRVTRQGSAFLGIIEYAKESEIDLIVLGTHGRNAIAQILMGSVAERVVRKSPCPVLTVRPASHNFEMP